MKQEQVEGIYITERVNGWWVSVRYAAGNEEHHGPYVDQEVALNEAELLRARLSARTTESTSTK